MLVETEAPAQRLLLARRWRPEAEVDGKAEQLDAVARHAAAQRDLARAFGRRDHQVGLAERPAAVEVDEVGDHRHQSTRPAALADGLVRDVVEQRVHGKDDVGVVLGEEVRHDLAHRRTEDRADRGKRRPRVARVIDRAPGRARPRDHGRVKRRKPADDSGALADERVGDGDDAGRVEKPQRVGQRSGRRAVPAPGVAEKNEDARRAADRGGIERGGFGYRRRAAARRAIQRML